LEQPGDDASVGDRLAPLLDAAASPVAPAARAADEDRRSAFLDAAAVDHRDVGRLDAQRRLATTRAVALPDG